MVFSNEDYLISFDDDKMSEVRTSERGRTELTHLHKKINHPKRAQIDA